LRRTFAKAPSGAGEGCPEASCRNALGFYVVFEPARSIRFRTAQNQGFDHLHTNRLSRITT
jgi:hypothetical protein